MTNYGKVVCMHALTCSFHKKEKARGIGCGAARPHDPRDCEPCSARKEARCVPVCQAGIKDCNSPATRERQSWDMRRWYPACKECAERFAAKGFNTRIMEEEDER